MYAFGPIVEQMSVVAHSVIVQKARTSDGVFGCRVDHRCGEFPEIWGRRFGRKILDA